MLKNSYNVIKMFMFQLILKGMLHIYQTCNYTESFLNIKQQRFVTFLKKQNVKSYCGNNDKKCALVVNTKSAFREIELAHTVHISIATVKTHRIFPLFYLLILLFHCNSRNKCFFIAAFCFIRKQFRTQLNVYIQHLVADKHLLNISLEVNISSHNVFYNLMLHPSTVSHRSIVVTT